LYQVLFVILPVLAEIRTASTVTYSNPLFYEEFSEPSMIRIGGEGKVRQVIMKKMRA